jgi:hypothetical protein
LLKRKYIMQIKFNESVVTEQGFRAMFPATSMPQPLTDDVINSFGGAVVFEGPQATGGTVYQYSQSAGVEEIGGKWFTKHILGPVFTDSTDEAGVVTTAAEAEAAYKAMKDAEQAKAVRASRDTKLAATDWVVIKAVETGTAVPEAVAAERQALRDITTQAGFPWAVEFPTQPE